MQSTHATVMEADAADYRFPEGNIVLFLFNPFSQEVMSRAIANLRESLTRKIYVIYFAPVCAALLDASGFLTRVGEGIPGERGIQLWKSVTA